MAQREEEQVTSLRNLVCERSYELPSSWHCVATLEAFRASGISRSQGESRTTKALADKLSYARDTGSHTICYIGSTINELTQRNRADLLARDPALFAWIAQTLDQDSPILSARSLRRIDRRATQLAVADSVTLGDDQRPKRHGLELGTRRICDGAELDNWALQFVEWLAVVDAQALLNVRRSCR